MIVITLSDIISLFFVALIVLFIAYAGIVTLFDRIKNKIKKRKSNDKS